MLEKIYKEWDRALSENNMEALLDLYAEDATIESPLIPHLLETTKGIVSGKKEIKGFLDVVRVRKPPIRKFYKGPTLSDGNIIMFEYPRKTPTGDQMDFLEVMEINNKGKIQKHRVYWGWVGFNVLNKNKYFIP